MYLLRIVSFSALVVLPLLSSAQSVPAGTEDGARLYQANCAVCHGQNGDSVPGVALARGGFRRVTTDEQIVAAIRNGIPGTPMPPAKIDDAQAGRIVAYLRAQAATISVPGDPAHGQAIFNGKGQCAGCHRVNGAGGRRGPDLSDIGALRKPEDIQKSLLDPDAEILPANRSVRLVTKEGATVEGRLLNIDTFTVQVLDSHDKLTLYQRASLKQLTIPEKSPMPSVRGRLSDSEVEDLVAYLFKLKGVDAQGGKQ